MTNDEVKAAAQAALDKQKEDDYEKRLAEKRARRQRVSAIGIDNPFDVPERFRDKRFHYAIINDRPGHIADLQSRGYELVTDKALAEYLNQKPGDPIKFATGMDNPAWAYLMRIEEELFQEDQRTWQEEADAKMQALGEAPTGLAFAKDAQIDGINLQKENVL